MADMMTFPETWEEFEKSYGFDDSDEVYTNGSRLIPSFRVKQWLDHIAHRENERQATVSSECVSRGNICDWLNEMEKYGREEDAHGHHNACAYIAQLPPTQLDRDIPKKPREIMDSTWGIHKKQAVCPECDCYLGYVSFLGGRKGKRVTYCEVCGQAIDWEGWDFDD